VSTFFKIFSKLFWLNVFCFELNTEKHAKSLALLLARVAGLNLCHVIKSDYLFMEQTDKSIALSNYSRNCLVLLA